MTNKPTDAKLIDFTLNETQRKKAVIYGCLIGDSLGATSEFKIPNTVGGLMKNGWPSTYIGSKLWQPGEPTDDSDMAMCILRSYISRKKKFDPKDVLKNFIQWAKNGPKDMGFTTKRTLSEAEKFLKNDKEWYLAGLQEYENNKKSAPNGSLMRNAVIPVITLELDEISAIDQTVEQSMITHFGPLPVLTCFVQTIIIRKALLNEEARQTPPTFSDISDMLSIEWKRWKDHVKNRTDGKNPGKIWLETVGEDHLLEAESQLLDELKDFEKFDPYTFYYKGVSGYAVLSLKIALWSLYHSFEEFKGKIPEWLDEWPFKKYHFQSIMWVALIGADSDTYGAIAGPLLAGYHPIIPENLINQLQLHNEIEKIFYISQ